MEVTIKTKKEIAILREGGAHLSSILAKLAENVRLGGSALELDGLAEGLIFSCGGAPAFKGYMPEGAVRPYPASICVSVNDEVVHGIPTKQKIFKDGDVVSVDIGMVWPAPQGEARQGRPVQAGLYTDMAITIGVGKITSEHEKLIQATKEALAIGISAVRPGVHIGDISSMIQARLDVDGFGVVRDLAGHGVGYELHEAPFILNYGKRGTGLEVKEGMVLALEPMATTGGFGVRLAKDNWTFKTKDGSIAAHFEHTIAVTKNGCEVLTRSGGNGVL